MRINKKDFLIILLAFLGLSSIGLVYKNYIVNKNVNIENEGNKKIFSNEKTDKSIKNNPENINDEIFVYIDGEIRKPGLYKMKNNDRVKHLIDIAGGFTENSDLSKINLAIKLKDEMKVHIYKIGEKNDILENKTENSDNNSSLININSATKEELMKITGIGETKAEKIIEYREKNKFNSIEDIIKVKGIGKKTFEKIKKEITVD